MNTLRKKLSVLLIILAVTVVGALTLVSCKKDNKGDDTPPAGDTRKEGTYRTAISDDTALTWNNHQWQVSTDLTLINILESPLYEIAFADDTFTGTVFANELAAAAPVDVTSTLTAEQKILYGVPAAAKKGYAWRYDIIDYAKFQNGDPITAQTFIDSMELLLNGKYLNSRAKDTFNGEYAIANARNYYGGSLGHIYEQADHETPYEDIQLALSFSQETYYFGMSLTAFVEDYGDAYKDFYFTTNSGINVYDKWLEIVEDNGGESAEGYWNVPAEYFDELIADFEDLQIVGYEGEWLEMLFTLSDVEYTEFSTVGIFANNDYSITKVYVEPITKFGAWMSNTTPELVHKATYEGAIIDPNAALLQTKYGTTNVLSNYMAYGPYKMTSYQIGKQFVFERNENWYGYSEFDTEHKNTYATKGIIINVIEQPEQQLLSFLNGDLDDVMLDAQNMSTYRHSPYLQYTPTDYTRAFFLNSDLDALQQLDANNDGNINSIALTNESFRRALSFAINRQEYCDNTAGDIPAYSLFNRLYTYNMEEEMQTGIDYRYRDLTVAKEAILGIYGIKYGATEYYKTLDDAYEAVTGLDVELATSLLNKAYLELVEAGIGFDTSKPVVIKIAISVKTNQVTAAFNKINENLAVAAAATPFKGVSFELQVDPDRYNSLLDGTVAAISGAWGGATMRPFYIISCYTDPASRLEYGFNPEETDLTLFVDFDGDGEDEEITLDLDSWQNAINNGIYSAVDEDDYKDNEGVLDEEAFAAEEARLLQLRLYVLSKLEEYILSTAHTIPISSETDISLLGKKISTPVEEYSSYKGWGGLRDYTYNYTDEEWASYVQSIGGTVDYV